MRRPYQKRKRTGDTTDVVAYAQVGIKTQDENTTITRNRSHAVGVNDSFAGAGADSRAVAVNDSSASGLFDGRAVAVNGGNALAALDGHAVATNGCTVIAAGSNEHCHG